MEIVKTLIKYKIEILKKKNNIIKLLKMFITDNLNIGNTLNPILTILLPPIFIFIN